MAVQEFKEHKVIRNFGDSGDSEITEDFLKKACKKSIAKHETIHDIDGDKHDWAIIGQFEKSKRSWTNEKYRDEVKYLYQKFGRTAICLKTGLRRTLTMGEFYGTGVVD